jgi:hypothetical protein
MTCLTARCARDAENAEHQFYTKIDPTIDNFHVSLVVLFRGVVQMVESQAMENVRNQRRRLSVFYVPASQRRMKRTISL